MSNTNRKVIPMVCAKTAKNYELVFEKTPGSSAYTFVRPQLPSRHQTSASKLFEKSTSDYLEEDEWGDSPSRTPELAVSDKIARPQPEKKEEEIGISLSDIDFSNCKCPECESEGSMNCGSAYFDFIRCGACQRNICPSSITTRGVEEFFNCPCGREASLSPVGELTQLEQGRTEGDAAKLQNQVRLLEQQRYLPNPKKN